MTQTKTRRPRRTYTDEFKNQHHLVIRFDVFDKGSWTPLPF